MCNNEKERGEEGRALHTVSMWAHLDNVQERFRNENYVLKDEVSKPSYLTNSVSKPYCT